MSRFDISRFKSPPDEELVCGICKNVLDNPKESQCRHVFCQACIKRALQEKPKCPICRTSCRERNLKDVLPLVQNLLNKLPMECENYENGCETPIPMERYLSHVTDCEYMMVTCSNSTCEKRLLKRDSRDHETLTCEYRKVTCDKGCQCQVVYTELEQHNCLKALLALNSTLSEKIGDLNKRVEELQSIVSSFGSSKSDNKEDGENSGRRAAYSFLNSYSGSPLLRSPINFAINSLYNDSDSSSEPFSINSPSVALSGSPVMSDCSDDEEYWGSDIYRNSDVEGNNEFNDEELRSLLENDNEEEEDSDRLIREIEFLAHSEHDELPRPIVSESENSNSQMYGAAAASSIRFQDFPSSSTQAGDGQPGSSRKRPGESGNSDSMTVKRLRIANMSEPQANSNSNGNSGPVRRSARLRNIPTSSPVSNIECVPVPPPTSYLLDVYSVENTSSSDGSWSPSHDVSYG